MNIKLIEKSILPFFFAILFIIAFYWQFIHTYAFFIEHFKESKLSSLYAHLLIYSFLVFTIFLFLMNIVNNLIIKSKVFIITIVLSLFIFYGFSYKILLNSLTYFISYPLSTYATMFLVLFSVSTVVYGIYTLATLIFNKFIPFGHSMVFLFIALMYATWFIDFHAYPIEQIHTKF